MLITQLIKAPLRYSQLENIEIINLKLVLCLPLILIDGANMVDFAKSSVLKGSSCFFFELRGSYCFDFFDFQLRKSGAKIQTDQIQKYKNMTCRTLCAN